MSNVAVVVPFYNQHEHTIRCIKSLLRTYGNKPSRIVIYNDGSSEESAEKVSRFIASETDHTDIVFISSEENRGFINAVNSAFLFSVKGLYEYFVILNNDTVVSSNWLFNLVAAMETNPNVGVVGPLTTYGSKHQMISFVSPNDNNQIDYRSFNDETIEEVGKWVENSMTTNIVGDDVKLSGFCMGTRSSLFETAGMFNKEFGFGSAEESYYRWQLRTKFKKTSMLVRNAFVWHYGHVTFGSHPTINSKQLWQDNQKLFDKLTGAM